MNDWNYDLLRDNPADELDRLNDPFQAPDFDMASKLADASTIQCPAYETTCGFEMDTCGLDPDTAVSEMMRHLIWRHGASQEQARDILAQIRTVR